MSGCRRRRRLHGAGVVDRGASTAQSAISCWFRCIG